MQDMIRFKKGISMIYLGDANEIRVMVEEMTWIVAGLYMTSTLEPLKESRVRIVLSALAMYVTLRNRVNRSMSPTELNAFSADLKKYAFGTLIGNCIRSNNSTP